MSHKIDAREGSRAAQPLEAGLYVVATPIGNLRDVTLRALDVLSGVDVVLAEDTRITRRLLDAYAIATPMEVYHDHNAADVRPDLIARLQNGVVMALVSDAGTPLVSDPGFKLVRDVAAAGVRVIPIPGPSAALAALACAGLATDRFTFAGFPPPKAAARERWLAGFTAAPGTVIVYETGRRLAAVLAAMAQVFGDRDAVIARELTKRHEEVVRGSLSALAARYADHDPPRGEIVILVGPGAETAWTDEQVDAALRAALDDHPVKTAAAEVADAAGRSKREVYARAVALKQAADERGGA